MVKIPVQAHSNPTFDVEKGDIFGPANAIAIQRGIAIALKSKKEVAPSTRAPNALLAPAFQTANTSAVKLIYINREKRTNRTSRNGVLISRRREGVVWARPC